MLGRGPFALVERSLRVDTRLLSTHLLRLVFAGVILLFLAQVQIDLERYSTPGRDVFQSICWINFFLLNMAGVSFFATAITEEREEMTLGLLRMAGISGVGILLGKVSPRLIGAVLLLSVQLPFTFLAITLGGVTTHQILAAYLALLAFAVMLAGLGGLMSTLCSRSNLAASTMTAMLGAFYAGPWLTQKLLTTLLQRGWITSAVHAPVDRVCAVFEDASTWKTINTILATNYDGALISYQVVTNLGAGVVLFGLSWLLFDRCTRNETPVAPARGLMALFSKRLASAGTGRVWAHALVWKDFNFLTGGLTAVLIKLVAYALLMTGLGFTLARNLRSDASDNIGAMLMLSMLTALAVEIPIYLSRVFREELRWNTWPMLVLLPDSLGRIVWQKVVGVLPTFLPAVILCAVGAFLSPSFLMDVLRKTFLEMQGWFVLSQYVLGLYLVVLLSLVVKWGALPLGVALVVVSDVLLLACVRSPSDRFLAVPMILGVVATGIIHMLILGRLRALAAQN